MTDGIKNKNNNPPLDDEDPTFDPASEDETKVVLESLEPQKRPDPPKTVEAPAKKEVASVTAPSAPRMKKASDASKKAGACGSFSCVLGLPARAFQAYRGIKSTKARWAVSFGIGLVIGVGAFVIWPSAEQEVAADATHETCEFLARPAAKLYIDGELAAQEVPPILRTRLGVGEHSVRFVSPENRTHEATIRVVSGRPTQWFMNFVSGTFDERPLIPEKKEK